MICSILAIIFGLCVLSFGDNETETSKEAEQHFEKAYEQRQLSEYEAAITEFEQVIKLAPKSAIAQNAKYWIAQLYFGSKQFDAALSTFEELIEEFPTSLVVPTTKTMIERVQQAKMNRALFEAVKKGDIEQAKQLIADGADIDGKWSDVYNENEGEPSLLNRSGLRNSTPLWHAVQINNMDLIKLLVEAGADVNAGSWPPLCMAVDWTWENTETAEYLIDHGANMNYPEGWGALQEAVHNIDMLKLMLAKGANINSGPWPALNAALVRRRPRDVVELLIEQGADVNAIDIQGYCPLGWVTWVFGDSGVDILKTLINKGADVNLRFSNGGTVLEIASWVGSIEASKLFLEAGADISVKNDSGQTALHVAADYGNNSIVALLLEKGADINAKDKYGRTPLHFAVESSDANTVELLLDKGANIQAKDPNGRTPLHLAIESADVNIIQYLLDKGADINAKENEFGFTTLHYASQFGYKNIVELLIARNADINVKDKEGHTPLYIAVNHDYKVAELLLDKGADSSIKTESGQTLLELAQKRKQIESTVPDMIFDGDPNSQFGREMVSGDIDGDGYDDIVIATQVNYNNRGRVYLFYGGPDIDTKPDLIFEGENEGDHFGNHIVCGDIDNDGYDDILVGAYYFNNRQGRAYLYWGSDRNSMDSNPDKIFTGEEGSYFSAGRPAIYDIDNDGYNDIIIGATVEVNANTGQAYLYYGNTKELMDTFADLIFDGENSVDRFGYTIGCGDVDNDGYGDIVIGYTDNNKALLYYGNSKSKMDVKADATFEQVEDDGYFGRRNIICIDQNRDGYDDIIIGASRYKGEQGRVYLYHGNSQKNMDAKPEIIFNGEVKGSAYGLVGNYGDIDGDDVNDLIISACHFGKHTGRVYVYWGSELSGPDPKPGRILTGENPDDVFGWGRFACGDVNNDGYDDLIIGAHGYKGGSLQGRVYLYYGGPK